MFSKKIVSVFGIFLILLVLNTGFISAAKCKGYDGYWRTCEKTYSKYNNPFTKWNFWEKKQVVEKEHSYAVNKISHFNPGYYKFNYNLEYSNEYDTGVYGYDKFTYYDNGYEHTYKKGYYGKNQGYVHYNYEEQSGYHGNNKYSEAYSEQYQKDVSYEQEHSIKTRY